MSLSARRAWIEIKTFKNVYYSWCVALRKESGDRNWYFTDKGCKCSVALRKESVDRNMSEANLSAFVQKSLSARRAWIEIMGYY